MFFCWSGIDHPKIRLCLAFDKLRLTNQFAPFSACPEQAEGDGSNKLIFLKIITLVAFRYVLQRGKPPQCDNINVRLRSAASRRPGIRMSHFETD